MITRFMFVAVGALSSISFGPTDTEDLPIRKTGGSPNKNYGYAFLIGAHSAIVQNNFATEVDKATMAGPLVVTMGRIAALADIATVFNSATGDQCLQLLCYHPSLSKDGRYRRLGDFFPGQPTRR